VLWRIMSGLELVAVQASTTQPDHDVAWILLDTQEAFYLPKSDLLYAEEPMSGQNFGTVHGHRRNRGLTMCPTAERTFYRLPS